MNTIDWTNKTVLKVFVEWIVKDIEKEDAKEVVDSCLLGFVEFK